MNATRVWRDHTKDCDRYRTSRATMLVAAIVAGRPVYGWTVAEIARVYREEVGPVSTRTVSRVCCSLELLGVVEVDKSKKAFTVSWVGWPMPFYT